MASSSPYLSRPAPAAQPIASSSRPPAPSSSAAQKPDRLYIGNLSPTVDELTLIQIFSKFGNIKKMDFLFHKTGVMKGKPRGFAFVEFGSRDDALRAMIKLHDKPLRGRKLVVTSASHTAHEPTHHHTGPRRSTDPPKTTTLSLIKSQRAPKSAAAQIAALERKLAIMQDSPLAVPSASAGNSPAPGSPYSGAEGGGMDWEGEGEGEGGNVEGEVERLQREMEMEMGVVPESASREGEGETGQSMRETEERRSEHPVMDKHLPLPPLKSTPKPTLPLLRAVPGLPKRPSQAVIDSARIAEVGKGR